MPYRLAVKNCERCYETSKNIDNDDLILASIRDNYANEAMKALLEEIKKGELNEISSNLSKLIDDKTKLIEEISEPNEIPIYNRKADWGIDKCVSCNYDKPRIKEIFKEVDEPLIDLIYKAHS